MSARSLVTIGIPVFNEEEHIASALKKLQEQDYPNLELVVADNGSVDRTLDICREFAAADPRVRIQANGRNIGAGPNFAQLVDQARGEYFMWASGHDLREPSFISTCIAALEADPDVVLAYPLARWLHDDGSIGGMLDAIPDTRHLDPISRFQVLLWSVGYAYPIYGVHRISALRRVDVRYVCFGPDIVILSGLALLGAFALVPEPLFHVRFRPGPVDWGMYLERILGRRTAPLEAEWMLVRSVYGHIRNLFRYSSWFLTRYGGAATVLLWFAVKQRRFVGELWRANKRHPLSGARSRDAASTG
jgi:glycosyltransferase involved in cell wall biosynthesis